MPNVTTSIVDEGDHDAIRRHIERHEAQLGTRESAASLLERAIAELRADLAGMEKLLAIAKNAEEGSPLESILWRMLTGGRFLRR